MIFGEEKRRMYEEKNVPERRMCTGEKNVAMICVVLADSCRSEDAGYKEGLAERCGWIRRRGAGSPRRCLAGLGSFNRTRLFFSLGLFGRRTDCFGTFVVI